MLSMHRGFTKLFNTIVTSTIWQEDDTTRIVWITMLAIADADGKVSAAIPGLASVANVTVEDCEKAVNKLKSPDSYSRTKDFDGRRIEETDGGWTILNYLKYRRMMSEEERREYKRIKQQEYRKRGQSVDKCSTSVDSGGSKWTKLTQAEAEAEAEAESRVQKQNKDIGTKGSSPTLKFPNGLTDSEWLAQLTNDSTYKGIDVKREHGKMTTWCKANNKAPTRRRFVNWLNRADRPMESGPTTYHRQKEAAPVYAKAPPPQPPLTPEEIERNKKLSSQMVNDLKKKMQP